MFDVLELDELKMLAPAELNASGSPDEFEAPDELAPRDELDELEELEELDELDELDEFFARIVVA